jgi:hypothetical protein
MKSIKPTKNNKVPKIIFCLCVIAKRCLNGFLVVLVFFGLGIKYINQTKLQNKAV